MTEYDMAVNRLREIEENLEGFSRTEAFDRIFKARDVLVKMKHSSVVLSENGGIRQVIELTQSENAISAMSDADFAEIISLMIDMVQMSHVLTRD